ncbi:MAG: leucine-rich repeat protein, partial [Oscillospiraceae bacterium]|nr:leucine-rich repeat protein [Oscillospiraceae bacterium]
MKKLQAFLAALLLTATSISGLTSSAFDIENLPKNVFVYENWLYQVSNQNSVILVGVVDTEVTSVTIPAEIDGRPVTDLVDEAAMDYTIERSISDCRNLTEIIVDEENEYFEVVDGALISKITKEFYAYPPALEKDVYTIPENLALVNHIFNYCCNLKDLTFSKAGNVDSFGSVYNCNALEKVTISDTLQRSYFQHCPKLKEVNLNAPEEPTWIMGMKFSDLNSLETLDVPENYNIRSFLTFLNCPALRKISLPGQLGIDSELFVKNCNSLESLDLSEVQSEQIQDSSHYAKVRVADCAELKDLKLTDFCNYTITDLSIIHISEPTR